MVPILVEETRKAGAETVADQRTRFQTDRDRILYSDEFRRLAGVTQVTSAVEGRVFHNRLTHSLKVAQIARRLAERLLRDLRARTTLSGPAFDEDVLQRYGGLDPDVVEAAALAHDLGHPPFGHVAEDELHQLCRQVAGLEDGFEGNAQSFRIVTRLAAHRPRYNGLDLTRATLNALMKYPYCRDPNHVRRSRKWGVYKDDQDAYNFARMFIPYSRKERRTLEAEIMDFADDLTFSVHDFDDFYRAGLIPLANILRTSEWEEAEGDPFSEQRTATGGTTDNDGGSKELTDTIDSYPFELRSLIEQWIREREEVEADFGKKVDDTVRQMIHRDLAATTSFARGSHEDRARLQQRVSHWIDSFLTGVTIGDSNPREEEDAEAEPLLKIPPHTRLRMRFLHFLVDHFVICHPRLATLQFGQRKVVRELWVIYFRNMGGKVPSMQSGLLVSADDGKLIPPAFQHEAMRIRDPDRAVDGLNLRAGRLAADVVASFSDDEAVKMHQRLHGATVGSVTDVLA